MERIYLCNHCSKQIGPNDGRYCDPCKKVLSEYEPSGAPALHGMSDGPGTQSFHFNRPKPYAEVLSIIKRMEAEGKIRTLEQVAMAKKVLSQYNPADDGKVDWGNERHRLDD